MDRTSLARALQIGIQGALTEIAVNRFRSILNLAGIALSIGALGSMLSIQEGARRNMEKTIQAMGGVGRIGMRAKSPVDLEEEIRFSRSAGQRVSDADTINSGYTGLAAAYKAHQVRLNVEFLGEPWSAEVRGVDRLSLEEGENIHPIQGRFFRPHEYADGDRVAVVGWLVAERLAGLDRARHRDYDRSEPRTLYLSGRRYAVVGAYAKENRRWEAPGLGIYIPMRAMERDFSGKDPRVEWLILDIGDPTLAIARTESLAVAMARSHRGAQDVTFRFFEWIDEYQRTMSNLQIVFTIIGGIAFFVGGANIFNLMLSTIAERMREIGFRKALGASSLQIFLQFLAESVTLSLCGGLFGAILGHFPVAFADAVEKGAGGIRPYLDLGSLGIIAGFTVALGILAGIYPAWKASRLNPVEALQYD